MSQGRRVGTLTCGLVLILFGVLFLLRVFNFEMSVHFIASLWPLILILLGLEMIISYVINKNEKIKYDFGAILLVFILAIFAMGMGGVEFIINHEPQISNLM